MRKLFYGLSTLARALHYIKRKTIKYFYIMKNSFKEVAQLVAAVRNLLTPNETGVSEQLNFTASRDTEDGKEVFAFHRNNGIGVGITATISKTEKGMRVEWEEVGDLDVEKALADLQKAKTWGL